MIDKDIVIVGYAGCEGCKLISKAKFEELTGRFRRDYLNKIIKDDEKDGNPQDFSAYNIDTVIHVTEGGILAALYSMAKTADIGLSIEIRRIPVMQTTIEVCELYELNPYRLYSNCYILLCDNGFKKAREISKQGIVASYIGSTSDNIDKIIIDKDEIEYINRPTKDEIYRIIPEFIPIL